MKAVLIAAVLLVVVGASFAQDAPFTFQVIDTVDQSYAPGFKFKGSWDTLDPHSYDDTWANGYLYDMYDDGTHGDETAGDHVWTRLLYFVPDSGVNTWAWGVTDTAGNWIDGDWQFQVVDSTPDTLTYVLPGGTAIDVTVTFSVYMGLLDTTAYAGGVGVQGDALPLDWTPGSNPMTDLEPDSIFTVDLLFPAGSERSVQYKYTRNDGGWNWESFMGNRFFDIDDSSPTQVLPMDYYERNAHPSTRDVKVTFVYNCGAFSDEIDNGVWLVGSRAPLDWGAPDLSNPLDSVGNWIYELDVTFPAGTNKNVEFKAIIDADVSGWNEAELTGMNRDFVIDDMDSVQVLDTLYYNNVMPTTAVSESGDDLQTSPSLSIGNFPNPFSRGTSIVYSVAKKSHVKLTIYDLSGRVVMTLVDQTDIPGIHRIGWNGVDSKGELVPQGVYFSRLETSTSAKSAKLILVR
jgi:hypothetical protein